MNRILIIDEGELDGAEAMEFIRRAELVLVRTADGYVVRKHRYGRNEDVQVRVLPGDPEPFTLDVRPLTGASG